MRRNLSSILYTAKRNKLISKSKIKQACFINEVSLRWEFPAWFYQPCDPGWTMLPWMDGQTPEHEELHGTAAPFQIW